MASEIILAVPDTASAKSDGADMIAQSRALVVTDKGSHELALRFIVLTKTAEKTIKAKLDPIVSAAHEAHKRLTALRSELLAPILEARQMADRKALTYEASEREKAEAERRRLEALARKADEEKRLQDAILAEEMGEAEEAEAILDEPPAPVPIIHVETATAKVAGTSQRELWRAEVTNFEALVKFVALNPSWLHLLEPDTTAINGLARSQRGALAIPGVRAVSETIRSIRTA